MKRSKRYIKKQQKKELINKKVLQRIIRESNLCQHAIKELKLAGYGKGEGGPNDWMYQQVLEALAVFASHGNSGSSAPYEIHLVQKLCNWDVISPLKFTDNEWNSDNADYVCQNIRKGDVFKNPDGTISYNGAFVKRPVRKYSFNTKEWTNNINPITYNGGLFVHNCGALTGRYFRNCNLCSYDINYGWMPKECIVIDCVEVEISPNNWITAVQEDSIDLIGLSCRYDIQWKDCPCLKGIRLENITPELEVKAYNEMQKGFDVK